MKKIFLFASGFNTHLLARGCCFILFFYCISSAFSQNNIYDIINKEIVLNDTWAGQSIELVRENNNYYIYRKIYGSGVPYIGIIKYKAIINSEYKITFSEIISIPENIIEMYNRNETFEIFCRNGIEIYLNGINLHINKIIE